MPKRSFDILISTLGLVALAPLMLLIGLLVKLTSPGPVFFRQERMGRGFRPFRIYKFRTMVADAPKRGAEVTSGGDPRITMVGRWLRLTKLDELPQLWNVLRGEMSLVGPRPEVRTYVERFADDFRELLSVRPGITGLASIEYRDEASVLARAEKPEEEYVRTVLPAKIRLEKEYLRRASFLFDQLLIVKTVWKLARW